MVGGGLKEKKPVAYLDIWGRDSIREQTFQDSGEAIPIFANEEFYIGRARKCRFQSSDPTISNTHLHIHCIIFEEDASVSDIPPLIYAKDLSTNGTYLTNSFDVECIAERRMRPNSERILLRRGDIIRIGSHISLHFVQTSPASPNELTELQQRETKLFKDRYAVTNQKIGSGGHGSVFVAIHKKTNSQLACKVVDLKSFKDEVAHTKPYDGVSHPFKRLKVDHENDAPAVQVNLLKLQQRRIRHDHQFREFDILKDLDHPNIIRLEKVFWSPDTLYMFQELVTGGDLFSFLERKGGRLADIEAAVILRQILKAVEYLHDQGIVHRDLKPDNIMMTSWAEGARIILTDFGNTRRLAEPDDEPADTTVTRNRMFTIVGTLEYAAPEIHKKNPNIRRNSGYSKAVDMWSIGIIATALLTGDVIFTNRVDPNYRHNPAQVILGMAAKCDLSILDDGNSAWQTVGRRPKDFVRKLLVLDESPRMTVKEALAHEWFAHKHLASEFDAVYERAIDGWQPRRKIFRMVEALDVTRLPPTKVTRFPSASPFFAASAAFVLNASPPSHDDTFNRRVHTPLPRIDEEEIAGVENSSFPVVC